MDRRFEVVAGAQVVKCATCGRTEAAGRGGGKAGRNLPPDAIRRWFANRGWRVGATARKDTCPKCLRSAASAGKPEISAAVEAPQIIEAREIVMAKPEPEIIKSPWPGASDQPPRTITRDDRRLIFNKLEEVYQGENTGYLKGWNDERVAFDMGCPRAWVEMIRDENFGPIKAESSLEVQQITAALAAADETYLKATDELAQLNGDLAKVLNDQRQIAARQDQLGAVISGITRLLEKTRSELARVTGK